MLAQICVISCFCARKTCQGLLEGVATVMASSWGELKVVLRTLQLSCVSLLGAFNQCRADRQFECLHGMCFRALAARDVGEYVPWQVAGPILVKIKNLLTLDNAKSGCAEAFRQYVIRNVTTPFIAGLSNDAAYGFK